MRLLFVCTHNACRSILAEAVTRAAADDRLEVASAGSAPAGRIHPLTLEHLQARGYRTAGLRSKSFDDMQSYDPQVVITVCDSAASESCPVWLGNEVVRVQWGLPDPSHLDGSDADRAEAFGTVMAILEERIRALREHPFETMDGAQLTALLHAIAANH